MPFLVQLLLGNALNFYPEAAQSAFIACAAADIFARESGCPNNPTAACDIANDYDIDQPSCTFNFGTRNVTIKGTSLFDAKSNSMTFIAGSITLKKNGELRAKGTTGSPAGGSIALQPSGTLTIENLSDVSVSSSTAAGNVNLFSGGAITINGRVRAEGTASSAKGGSISVVTPSTITCSSSCTLSVISGNSAFTAGQIQLDAGGNITLAGAIDLAGARGGSLFVDTDQAATISNDINIDATADGSDGGLVEMSADAGITVDGRILARGKGGSGTSERIWGDVTLAVGNGNLTISDNILAEGIGYDGEGGEVDLSASGSVSVSQGVTVSAATTASEGVGGQVGIGAGVDFTSYGTLDVAGSGQGGNIDIVAGRHVLVEGTIRAKGVGASSFGGSAALLAGTTQFGIVPLTPKLMRGAGFAARTAAA